MPYANPADGLARQNARRQKRRALRLYQHPRCAICDGPMQYGANGVNLRAVTCSRACAIKRSNWMRVAS